MTLKVMFGMLSQREISYAVSVCAQACGTAMGKVGRVWQASTFDVTVA